MIIKAKIKKRGEFLGFVIPKMAVEELSLKENQEVVLEFKINGNPLK